MVVRHIYSPKRSFIRHSSLNCYTHSDWLTGCWCNAEWDWVLFGWSERRGHPMTPLSLSCQSSSMFIYFECRLKAKLAILLLMWCLTYCGINCKKILSNLTDTVYDLYCVLCMRSRSLCRSFWLFRTSESCDWAVLMSSCIHIHTQN